jgi:FkbM family methyltransferase
MSSINIVAEHITPFSVLDIGANRGHWAAEVKRKWPHSYVVCVEGNPECDAELKASGFSYRIALLADTEKEVTFYTRKGAPACTGCSIYREDTQFYAGDAAVAQTLRTETLDAMFPDAVFNLIKLDVQGAELDVLRGGKELVKRADALQLECSLEEYNTGAPLIDEVREYLRSIGFVREIHLENLVHPINRNVIQQDKLFLR